MDHKAAESLQSVERYTLNEMSAGERLQFEEHLFDCPLCAEQVRQNFTVVENLKEVLREEKVAFYAAAAPRRGWREWLRPITLGPSLLAAALAVVMVVQNAGPRVAPQIQAQILAEAPVLAPVSRGNLETIHVPRTASLFLLTASVDSAHADSYLCEFQDAAGHKMFNLQSAPQSSASVNLQFLLSKKSFPAGRYRIILRPVSEPDSITTYHFVIENS